MLSQPVGIYDFETTGLNPRYDQPIQFAAVLLDANLVEMETLNLRARPQKHIIPVPSALATHGKSIDEIFAASLSQYELMAEIETKVHAWTPATFMGYNSARFDDEFLRHSLYGALRQPYVIQLRGNARGDVLRAAQLARVLDPGSLVVPVKTGKPSFGLETLAQANGYTGHDAHDALGDVHATAHILRTIAHRASSTWELFSRLTDKNAVREMLQSREFVILVEHFGATIARPVAPICANSDYAAEWLGIDLSTDPMPILGLSPEELASAFAREKRHLCRIRTNAMPLVVPGEHPAATRLLPANVASEVGERLKALRAERGFGERVAIAARLGRREYPKATYVEDLLYEGGFFPLDADVDLVTAFHFSDPAAKLRIVDSLSDARARQLGRRIIYNDYPDLLSSEEHARMDQERITRLWCSDGPWTSVDAALAEIENLLVTAVPSIVTILQEYRRYLLSLRSAHAT
jgi:exodeoxyribonuclease-1